MTYLITGGSGSLGTALVAHLLRLPSTTRVIAFARNEHRLAALKARFPDPRVEIRHGCVRDRERLDTALRTSIDVLIHAAAMKRIESCQAEPREAYLTNVVGTANVCAAAVEAHIPRVLVVSSDKASESVSVYGASKAMAEGLAIGWNALAGASGARFSAVRYGNCYDSAGAVLHAFREAKAAGAPLKVTHPSCTRFWWSVDAAARYVVDVAKRMGGREIWVPKIGAAKVLDLAKSVWPDGPVEIVGVRGVEKLHEVMVSADESRVAYELVDSYVLLPFGGQPPPGARPVPDGFRFASDTAAPADLAAMVAA